MLRVHLDSVLSFPVEVRLVQVVVPVEQQEVVGQRAEGFEVGYVHVGAGRCERRVVDGRSAQHDGHDIVLQGAIEFLAHVIQTVGILHGKVEFVVGSEHPVAVESVVARELSSATVELATALAVHIHGNESTQLPSIVFPVALRYAVRHEPGNESVFLSDQFPPVVHLFM